MERTICPLCKGPTRSNMLRNFNNPDKIKPEKKYDYIFGEEALEGRLPREFLYEEDELNKADNDEYIYEDEEGNLYTEEDVRNGNFEINYADDIEENSL